MKTDQRTRYTKNMICNCFLDMLEEMPIQKITVKAICEKAEINRSTFYRYYKDPYDLMEQIENELWESFRQQIVGRSNGDIVHTLEEMFLAIQNERIVYVTLLSTNTGTEYFQHMVDRSYDMFHAGMQRRYPGMNENQLRWIWYYITQGILAITVDWYRRGMKESPAEMARFTAELDNCILLHQFPKEEH